MKSHGHVHETKLLQKRNFYFILIELPWEKYFDDGNFQLEYK